MDAQTKTNVFTPFFSSKGERGTGLGLFISNRILSQHGRSVHEVGLMDLMNMARFADRMPRRRALVGIQPEKIDWGTEPSPRVALAVPEAAQAVADRVKSAHPECRVAGYVVQRMGRRPRARELFIKAGINFTGNVEGQAIFKGRPGKGRHII